MIGIGSANLIVGAIKDSASYSEVMMFLLGCSSLAFVLTFVANYLDKRQFGSVLNNHRPLAEARKKEAERLAAEQSGTINNTENDDPTRPLVKV